MDYKAWQENFDQKKWKDSIIAGEDTCGSYDFCVKCKKAESEPCARAAERFENPYIRVAILKPRT